MKNTKKNEKLFSTLQKEGFLTENSYRHLTNKEIKNDQKYTGEKKISVIISTFNRCDDLLVMLQSIFSQTYKNFEIIICDDCSTDNTKETIFLLLESHKEIKYIRNTENLGPSETRKKGYEASSGDILIFADDDDCYINDNYFKKLADTFESDPDCSMTISSAFLCYKAKKEYKVVLMKGQSPVKNDKYLDELSFQTYKYKSFILALALNAKLMKEANFIDLPQFDDASFYLYGSLAKGNVRFIKEISSIQNRYGGTLQKTASIDFVLSILNSKLYIGQKGKEFGYISNLDKWLCRQFTKTIKMYFSKKIMDKKDGKTILNWCKSHLSFSRYLTILEKAKYFRFKVFLKKIARIS